MNTNGENKEEKKSENRKDPREDIETVVSKNDNVAPVPDKEELEDKKKPEEDE